MGQTSAVGRRFIDLGPELTGAVIRTVEAGWALALSRDEVTSDADEVTITECLRDAMRVALVEHRLPWRKTMIVAPGTESRSQPGMTAPDGRTDIPLYLTKIFARSGEHDPHAILECKRVVEGDAHLAREYVREGIDRFQSGRYSSNHSRGFMVGYVLSGTASGVVTGINTYLGKKARHAEVLAISPLIPTGWDSAHPRPSDGSTITLHHSMLAIA